LKDIKVSSIQKRDDSIYLEISQFNAKYAGKLNGDSLIVGMFEQGVSLPLTLKKITKIVEKKRPQTPTAPFPYGIEELVYTNNNKSISYGATLTIPKGKGPFPAVLLLTGSGQQNRDEEIMGHKPFAVIADHLTRNGFVVLRVDDRGMGETTGYVATSTSRDFANDASVSLDYLKKRKEVDKSKIGLIGHSEGGMLAQMLAAERKDIDFVIMLAGPGEKTIKLMKDQNEAILVKAGLAKEYIKAYLELYTNILITVSVSDSSSAKTNIETIVNKWLSTTADSIVVSTTGIKDAYTKQKFIEQSATQISHPWVKYFLSYDPAVYIKKIRAKVLAINGSQDIQVIAKTNLAGIENALKKGKSKRFEIKELKGLNHLFQECKTCTANEYSQLDQTISPAVLDLITTWMKKIL